MGLIHSKMFLRDFCFVKLTSYRSTCRVRGPRLPQLRFNNLFNEHFALIIFFFNYFVRKNCRGGGGLLLKNGTKNGYVYQSCYSWNRIYIARGSRHFGDYCNIFLPNIGENQKNSFHLSAGPLLALCHMVNLALVRGGSRKFWWKE